jgi:hypothetical protein
MRSCRWVLAALLSAVALSGCAPTSKVAGDPTPQSLTESKKGIALVRFSTLEQHCKSEFLAIGAPSGTGHRLVSVLYSTPSSPANARIAEVELEPGPYRVLGLKCERQRSTLVAGSGGGAFSESLAAFEVRAGEVVNIGNIELKGHANNTRASVAVTDMPIQELKRFEAARPALYAAMVTRLATAGPDRTRECADGRAMLTAGKITKLPAGCV